MLWGGCARARDPEVPQGGSQGLPGVLTPDTLSKRPVLQGANAIPQLGAPSSLSPGPWRCPLSRIPLIVP